MRSDCSRTKQRIRPAENTRPVRGEYISLKTRQARASPAKRVLQMRNADLRFMTIIETFPTTC